ncbi:2-C-methyl-D-erythritol 4-phosphate cytidylyltransferase [Psychrobacter sp. HD31]|uniref:2-C-methyl-D-erythritol 4-phosphate cytidylyltransferase n=1 Tax=Psychrobacter sp. HD31 TaxID=3112003 RepID=UPI003DA467D7
MIQQKNNSPANNKVNVFAMIVAAGKGSRYGANIPKQYLTVNHKTVVEHSVSQLAKSQYIKHCHLVISNDDKTAKTLDWALAMQFCIGGAERWHSVQAGMQAIVESSARSNDLVLIHDAARPCVLPKDVDNVIEAAMDEPYGAILATPVADTLKQVDAKGVITQTVDRSKLWQAQTPQVFRLGYLQKVLKTVAEQGVHITDEASGFEQLGYPIKVVEGSRSNMKLTYPSDLDLIGFLLNS